MSRVLKSLRELEAKTQQDMATLLGITRQAYMDKENGKTPFTLREAMKISEIFKKDIKEIFFIN